MPAPADSKAAALAADQDLVVVVAAKALVDDGRETYVFPAAFFDETTPVAKALAGVKGPWVMEVPSIEVLEELVQKATVFRSPLAPGRLFATSEAVVDDAAFVQLLNKSVAATLHPAVVSPAPEDLVVAKALTHIRIHKTAEERYVMGIVLEPDTVDSQGDIYSKEEVRKAAHRFMQEYRQLGKQHSEIVTGKLVILESWVAPTEFALGDETVKDGTWLMGIRVVDDALWSSTKKGDFTGFSIGGIAYREPETKTPTTKTAEGDGAPKNDPTTQAPSAPQDASAA